MSEKMEVISFQEIDRPVVTFNVVVKRTAKAASSGISATAFPKRYSKQVYSFLCRSRWMTGFSLAKTSSVFITAVIIILMTPKLSKASLSTILFGFAAEPSFAIEGKICDRIRAVPVEVPRRNTFKRVLRMFCLQDRSKRAPNLRTARNGRRKIDVIAALLLVL